jgi:hypothetical protein
MMQLAEGKADLDAIPEVKDAENDSAKTAPGKKSSRRGAGGDPSELADTEITEAAPVS